MRKVDMIIVHQTDTNTGTVDSIRRYHIEHNGWKDIGYHYVIYKDGSTHKGRINTEVGAHCKGDNETSIGICLVGKGAALPIRQGYMTQSQWTNLKSLISSLMQAYSIPANRIFGHRERPSGKTQGKTCPGFGVGVLREEMQNHPQP